MSSFGISFATVTILVVAKRTTFMDLKFFLPILFTFVNLLSIIFLVLLQPAGFYWFIAVFLPSQQHQSIERKLFVVFI